jgi:hypothetical protein
MEHAQNKRKGQSAIEYLTTYGWALLAIVLVGAILVQMGVFSQCNKSSPRFSGNSVGLDTWAFTDTGNYSFVFKAVKEDINITNVSVSTDSWRSSNASLDNFGGINSGQSDTIKVDASSNIESGECVSAELTVEYDLQSSDITGADARGEGQLRAESP